MAVDIDQILQQLGLGTAVLDEPEQTEVALEPSLEDLTTMMAEQTLGCRVSATRFGASKSFSEEQRRRAAEQFGADHKRTRGSKVLVDTKNEHYRKVLNVIRGAKHFWQLMTADYDEDGIRLIRKSKIKRFVEQMEEMKVELEDAKRVLRDHEYELRMEASQMLSELYNPADYPSSIADEFSLDYDFPNLTPSPELAKIGQQLFEVQLARHQAKLQQAVQDTVSGFTVELHEMVAHLADRLTPDPDTGKAKVFHHTTLENLREFFQSFQDVAQGMNPQLDLLFHSAQQVLSGVTPEALRKDALRAGEVRAGLHEVMSQLDTMLVDAPKRGIALD